MNGLRWTIGIVTAIVSASWVALALSGNAFRRSFGASPNSALMFMLPIVGGALVIASVAWPERRMLLHVVAALMVALIVRCLMLARETAFIGTSGTLYGALWLFFYYRMMTK
jgi:hypothetical protein